MTMRYASKVVEQAKAWLGCKESNGTHKQIIDVYNSHKPLARGYAVKYTDAWCATFVSAVAIKVGYTDIIPTECGCGEMINLFKKIGSWVESDSYKPNPGDIIFYDWQDNGKGDNTGWSDHVGIVEKVEGNTITIIEGNCDNAVSYRTRTVNQKYIRGYGVPKYDEESEETTREKPTSGVTVELDMLKKGAKGEQVKVIQRLLIALGYDLGYYGADGDFGGKTDMAVRAFQKRKNLSADGIVGKDTWTRLLKG